MNVDVACGRRVNRWSWGVADSKRWQKPRGWGTTPSGGNRWSASFTAASQRALGWSTGAHGLRHAYAQDRLEELQRLRMNYYEAREVLSQELGHFRGDVLETYLR